MAVKITIRPTPRQVLGRTLFIGSLSCIVALLPAVLYMAYGGRWRPYLLGAVFLAVIALALLVSFRSSRHVGVILDEQGIYPVDPDAAGSPYGVCWTRVADIRAERRRGRTVPVVYLDDPGRAPWRLRAPYSGRGLASDDELDEKIFVMRSLWESYRNGRSFAETSESE